MTTRPSLLAWHRALAAVPEIVVLKLERDPYDDHWILITLAARVGAPWDVEVSEGLRGSRLHNVSVDRVALTYNRTVTRPEVVAMLAAVVRDPRGNVGGPDMSSLRVHIENLVGPWQRHSRGDVAVYFSDGC